MLIVCGYLFTGQPVTIKTTAPTYIDYIVKMSLVTFNDFFSPIDLPKRLNYYRTMKRASRIIKIEYLNIVMLATKCQILNDEIAIYRTIRTFTRGKYVYFVFHLIGIWSSCKSFPILTKISFELTERIFCLNGIVNN